MFQLLQRPVRHTGTVYFRGSPAPRAEEFAFLTRWGFDVSPGAASPAAHWTLKLRHAKAGEATMACLRGLPPPPPELIHWSRELTPAERAEALSASVGVSVTLASSRGNVLRDRKTLLKILRAAMGEEGVVVVDHGSQRFWPRAALDDELAAPGEPDVSVLYGVHAVCGPERSGEPGVVWLHTHGLESVGAFDVEVLRPSPALVDDPDPLRALTFAAIEGTLSPSSPRFELASPGVVVRAVPVADFMRAARPADRDLRDAEDHHGRRAVLCDPAGLIARLRGSCRPSRALSGLDGDAVALRFSDAAGEMMAARARATLPLFRSLIEELAELELPVLAKLRYEAGAPGGVEHLWFSVHGISEDSIDATLESTPHDVPSLVHGSRGRHPTERLSEWRILSPAGSITPHDRRALRMIRERWDDVREAMRHARSEDDA